MDEETQEQPRRCWFFGRAVGCRHGDACKFLHDPDTPPPRKRLTAREKRAHYQSNLVIALAANEPLPAPPRVRPGKHKRKKRPQKRDSEGDEDDVAGSGDWAPQSVRADGEPPQRAIMPSYRTQLRWTTEAPWERERWARRRGAPPVTRAPTCWFYMNSMCLMGPFCEFYHPRPLNPYAYAPQC